MGACFRYGLREVLLQATRIAFLQGLQVMAAGLFRSALGFCLPQP
jgi:hypothetical protein